MAPKTSEASTPSKKAAAPSKPKATASRRMSDEIDPADDDSNDRAASPPPKKTASKKRARAEENEDEGDDDAEEKATKKARPFPEINFKALSKLTKDGVVVEAIKDAFADEEDDMKHEQPTTVKNYFTRAVQYPIPEKASETVRKRYEKLNQNNRGRVGQEEFLKISGVTRRLAMAHLAHLNKIGELKLDYEATIKRKDGTEVKVTKQGLQISQNALNENVEYVTGILVDILHGAKQVMASRGVSSLSVNDVETALNVAFPIKQMIHFSEDITKNSGIVDPGKSVFDIKRELKDGNKRRKSSRVEKLEEDIHLRKSNKLYIPEGHLGYLARKAAKNLIEQEVS